MSGDVAPGPARGAGRVVPAQTVALGALLSVVNGFVLASLQGAVGVVGREQTLLRIWIGSSVVMLPVYVGVVLGVQRLLARRGPARPGARSLVAVGAVAAAAVLTGTLAMAAFAARDVQVQDAQVDAVAWSHFHTAGTDVALTGGTADCGGACVVKRHTLQAHVRAVSMAAPVVLGLDLLATSWLLAAFGGEVAVPRLRRRTATDLSELVGTP